MIMDTIARAARLRPDIIRPSLQKRLKTYLPFIIVTAVFFWMCRDLGIQADSFLKGVGKLGSFFENMFPPTHAGQLGRILEALLETFAMAFAGTALAAIIALPLGLMGAKNVISFGPFHFTLRRVFDFFRGIPALIWALILVSAFGLGPFGGVIALALADIPVLAKLNSETFENIDEKQREGLKSVGASSYVDLRYGILPQVAPVISSQWLFYLESNFRNAAILGIVGAGGIGFELEERIRIFAFDQVAFIILLYIVCVAILDTFSARLRARLSSPKDG